MLESRRFPFIERSNTPSVSNTMPYLPGTKSTQAPLILGHMNFFAEFDVCFYRADLAFEVRPRIK
ncbi:hypothetical protein [Fischerella sp. JS2]|uniref:hypothetical protein n=1 Tax=Fischerella sp. JS2 TaxID=2597771 RepID=UPI0028EA56E2|nr:hypothetical protein [Fischerella sp. JS2]